jgi:hypothetical protein
MSDAPENRPPGTPELVHWPHRTPEYLQAKRESALVRVAEALSEGLTVTLVAPDPETCRREVEAIKAFVESRPGWNFFSDLDNR